MKCDVLLEDNEGGPCTVVPLRAVTSVVCTITEGECPRIGYLREHQHNTRSFLLSNTIILVLLLFDIVKVHS